MLLSMCVYVRACMRVCLEVRLSGLVANTII